MITYPGLPGPELSDYLPREASPARYGPGTEFHIGHMSTMANTGPVHTALLAAGIPIVEHLCGLDQFPPSGFRFHAAPPPVVGIGSFPVRAYAVMADV
jgi:kynurenine formamidase